MNGLLIPDLTYVLMTPAQKLGFARSKTLLKALSLPRTALGFQNTSTGQGRIQYLTTAALQESSSSSGLPFTLYPLSKASPPPPPPPPPQKIELSQTGLQRRMDGSFYMRVLPSSASLIPYDSPEGKKIFKQALDDGGLEAFFPLSQQFLTQEEPAYCGIGTLCMILNALKIDPARTWRKPWRWFTQDMLDCCRPLEYVRTNGITLSEFTCLAECNGLEANTKYADKISLEDFRQDVVNSTNSSSQIMAVSYSRAALGQTGSGHFSPVGGYSSYGTSGGYILILDVARFKYPSYWVSLEMLYESLRPVDPITKQPRGYSLLRRPIVNPGENGGSTYGAEGGILLKLGFTKATWPGWWEGLVGEMGRFGEEVGIEEVTAVVGKYISRRGGPVGTRGEVLNPPKVVKDSAAKDGDMDGNMGAALTTAAAAAYDPSLTLPSSQAYSAALTSFLTRMSTNLDSLYHQIPLTSATTTPTNHALTTILFLALYSFPPFLARVPSARAVREMERAVEQEIGECEEVRREVVGVRRAMASLEQCCREEVGVCARGCEGGECKGLRTRGGEKSEGGMVV
ncbi:Phytochelatin synthase-domain-containing protein [Tirmania nivea]|nr:Phytochelatin synthase-domain-containing protein [Tirmania nivea]